MKSRLSGLVASLYCKAEQAIIKTQTVTLNKTESRLQRLARFHFKVIYLQGFILKNMFHYQNQLPFDGRKYQEGITIAYLIADILLSELVSSVSVINKGSKETGN